MTYVKYLKISHAYFIESRLKIVLKCILSNVIFYECLQIILINREIKYSRIIKISSFHL
jgi:hypothetical protein